MDPALQLQQRITQGLSEVSQSLRISINSLVLGVSPNGAGGSSGSGGSGGSGSSSAAGGNTNVAETDVDLEKGKPELEHPGRTAAGVGDDDANGADGTPRTGEEGTDVGDEKPAEPQRPPLTLQTLPPEVQMLIVCQLNFGDIERLRRTCRFYKEFATPRMVRTLFGTEELRFLMLSHCADCLAFDEGQSSLLLASTHSPDYPLNAKCVDCAMLSRDERLVVGRKVTMGNHDGVWVCRWCGWPVRGEAAPGHAQFHRRCYGRYNDCLLFFFLLGWLQLGLGLVAAALAWRYFRWDALVFAPTVTSFILLWVCIFMLMFRGQRVRTYHWTLLFELSIVGLWVPPIYFLAQQFAQTPYWNLPRSTVATMVIFCLNMIFRLINVLGNLVLVCEYKRTNHYLPDQLIPNWRRFTNPIMDFLIFWTYPQSVEQKFPPHWS